MLTIDRRKTYLEMIQNSLGTNIFRSIFAIHDDVFESAMKVNPGKDEYESNRGDRVDILKDGKLSCAVYVSGILYLNKLVTDLRGNTHSLKKQMVNDGWEQIAESEVQPGAVIFWEKSTFSAGDTHEHVGFYVGNETAISNHYQKGYPVEHQWKKDSRGIDSLWWYPNLDKDSN